MTISKREYHFLITWHGVSSYLLRVLWSGTFEPKLQTNAACLRVHAFRHVRVALRTGEQLLCFNASTWARRLSELVVASSRVQPEVGVVRKYSAERREEWEECHPSRLLSLPVIEQRAWWEGRWRAEGGAACLRCTVLTRSTVKLWLRSLHSSPARCTGRLCVGIQPFVSRTAAWCGPNLLLCNFRPQKQTDINPAVSRRNLFLCWSRAGFITKRCILQIRYAGSGSLNRFNKTCQGFGFRSFQPSPAPVSPPPFPCPLSHFIFHYFFIFIYFYSFLFIIFILC